MTQIIDLSALAATLPKQTDRRRVQDSYDQHARNGRGFWPVVTGQDGSAQVIRFTPSGASSRWDAGASRWSADSGQIEVIPLHTLPATDWPRLSLPA